MNIKNNIANIVSIARIFVAYAASIMLLML